MHMLYSGKDFWTLFTGFWKTQTQIVVEPLQLSDDFLSRVQQDSSDKVGLLNYNFK